MHSLFKDPERQLLFEANGFVKVPLLNQEQVQKLGTIFESTRSQHETISELHHTTTDTRNIDLIYKVDHTIKSILVPELEKILIDFRALVGTFHIKETGAGSATGMHQDPTFVDESKYCSANVWVALHDIDMGNGNLYFIKGSNRAIYSLRITPASPNYYESFSQSLPEMAEYVPLKKGEAVIFNNATIHGASDNLSNRIRLAATLLVCSAPAEWQIYYRDRNTPDAEIEQYQLDLDTFVAMPKSGRPDKKALKQLIRYEFPGITKSDFLKATGNNRNQKKTYFDRVREIFVMNTSR